jgi:hypothetical protein
MTVLTFTLVDVDGSSHVLGDATGIYLAVGAKGLGMPSLSVNSDKLPYAPGSRLRRIATPPSKVDLPLFIQAASAAALEQLLDNLSGWVLPGTENDDEPSTVRFQVLATDGTSREIEGVCLGGLDNEDTVEAMGDTWQNLVLSFEVSDPYWQDTTDTTHTFTSGAGVRSWWAYWPYDLTPSNVFAEETISQTGQIETWPVWTITGPGSTPTLANLTTGASLELDVTLAAGDVVTIDTRPRQKTVTNQNGVNLFPSLSAASELWALAKGSNTLRVGMSSATIASALSLSYRRRWVRARRR